MSIKSKFPSIKPSLLLDFANVKQLDPRVTFVRTTTATYYDGKTTAKAEENLLLRSQDYSATWTVTNLTPVTSKTAPDGTSTATEFTAGSANAVLTQGYTAIAGSYTFSVFLRRVTGSGDIQIAADNGTWTTKTITGTWARYDVTQTVTAGSKTSGVRVVTSGDAIEVWGAQLEKRSAVTAYTPTTTQPITNYIPVLLTAPAGVARFDHNPTTGESLGLLVEEQRTNLQVYSQDFDNADWTKTRASIEANTIVAPDGTLTGDKLVEDTTATNTHQISDAFSYVSGTSYTFSIYAKAAGRSIITFFGSNAAFGATINARYDLTTGVATLVTAGTNTSVSMTAVGNGWYRCVFTSQATSTVVGDLIWRMQAVAGTNNYTGDGYSGIYIWGAQLEAGAFSTSYIPTVAATVTRNADAASMTGTNFSSWYRADEGTLYAEAASQKTTSACVVSLDDGGSANTINISPSNATGSVFFGVQTNNVGQLTGASRSASVVPFKTIIAYKTNDTSWTLNGEAVTTDASVLLPVVDRMAIGSRGASSIPLVGTIKKLSFYPARLSNAQLQALTTV